MKHFLRSEFECKCGCGMDTVDYELAKVADDLREHFGVPVDVSSGNRCVKHNEFVQLQANPNYIPYSSQSFHMFSKAADLKVRGVSPKLVYNYLNEKYPYRYGIGLYSSWVHLDVRLTKARW